MKITYDLAMMKRMRLFESITRAPLKDSFEASQTLFFIVQQGAIGKAVGPQGKNVKRLQELFKKKLRLVEFNIDMLQFLKNLVYPIQIKQEGLEGGVLSIKSEDNRGRSLLIGRNAQNLRATELILKRYFPLEELKVT